MKSLAEKLDAYVSAKRLRKSGQRNAVLEVMAARQGHFTVDEICSLLKKNNPDIGIATVYRTMKLFLDAGLVEELNIDGTCRYEILKKGHHDHLVCTSCGETIEITSDKIEKEQESIARKYGFELTDHTLLLLGCCSSCRNKKSSGDAQ